MPKKISVGYLTTSLSSEGGWGRYSKSLIESVAKSVEVKTVLTFKNAVNETNSVKCIKVLPTPMYHPVAQIKIFYYTFKHLRQCDVIHSLVEQYAPGAALACFLLRKHLVITLHGTYAVPPKKWNVKRVIMQFMYRVADITTTGSKYTENKVREVIPKLGECRFIPNGVDDKLFYNLANSVDKNFLLTVGELKSRKGVDVVIKALGMVKDKFPSLQYKVVGVHNNKNFFHYVQKLASDFGIQDRVQFLGRITDDELLHLYNECSIFILAAREVEGSFEGFPMVFYEANACGAPVISTRGFGSEYAIKDNYNGYIVEPDNPKQLADKITMTMSDSHLRNKLKEGALNVAIQHTWDNIGLQLVKLYHDSMFI